MNAQPRPIPIAQLLIEPALQARSTLIDPVTVNRYRGKVKCAEGNPEATGFPPIKVAEFPNGQLYVLDGFHRVEAHKAEGLDSILATVEPCSSTKDARWRAAEANLAHGKALSPKEVKAAFRRFVEARMHRQASPEAKDSVRSQRPNPNVMTLGEIAQVFGKAKSTVRAWFLQHDKKEFNMLYREDHEEMQGNGGSRPPQSDVHQSSNPQLFSMSLANARQVIDLGMTEEELTECLRDFNRIAIEITERMTPEGVQKALDGGFAPGWVDPSTWLRRKVFDLERPYSQPLEAKR